MGNITEKKEQVLSFFSELDFNSKKHLYRHKKRQLRSVSSIIKTYVQPFDANRIAGYVAKSRGISKEEVLEEWEEKKNKACDKGNRVHDFGENYSLDLMNGIDHTKSPTDGYERAVLAFWDSLPNHIVPFLMELKMFSKKLGIAGTTDIILYNIKTDKFIVADYKTNIDLFKNYRGKKMLIPFQELLDNPFNKYQIQLSLYQYLFEQCGFEVEDRKVIWLKPDGSFEELKTENYLNKLIN